MEVKEVVYCSLCDWELIQVEEKLIGVDAELIKGVKRIMSEKVQMAFDKGRKFEQDKLITQK